MHQVKQKPEAGSKKQSFCARQSKHGGELAISSASRRAAVGGTAPESAVDLLMRSVLAMHITV